MRFAVDTGGTFTDLIVEDDDGRLRMYKGPTTPHDLVQGVLDTIESAAGDLGTETSELLARGELLIHGTTISTNAVLTGNVAKTAFLTTRGHPDILVFREAGRMGVPTFDYSVPYPEPYIPRALTFEVPERIDANGEITIPLDEDAVVEIIRQLADKEVEAVGVCLLWSIAKPVHEQRIGALLEQHLPHVPYTLSHLVNAVVEIIRQLADKEVEAVGVCLLWSIAKPVHEQRIGALLEQHLPHVPYTLSHLVNPSLREYRRASSTCIDASLKLLMKDYLGGLSRRLRDAGFRATLLVVTSQGGVLDAAELARVPIHSIKSGPALAPIAGRRYAVADASADTAIIADAGGTSYDVSLVRRGRIPWTRETWIGMPYLGHMTGFPSVDVQSIGAGGGSIARVDEGGLINVGPQSAGSVPGPACYGQGGTQPTVTDAALLLGYIDPAYFLGGRMSLDVDAAKTALETQLSQPLGLDLHRSAAAVLSVVTENMVGAIEEITINQGIDPRTAVLVGGGGAAGLNSIAIARRLGCPNVIIPDVGASLSAAGALLSDLSTEYTAILLTTGGAFDFDGVNGVLAALEEECQGFINGPGSASLQHEIEFSVEAHYAHQIWEIEVPLRSGRVSSGHELDRLKEDFHTTHRETFAIDDSTSEIEFINWRARARCKLREADVGAVVEEAGDGSGVRSRQVYFSDRGLVEAKIMHVESMERNRPVDGPAIIESSFTTVVIDPGAQVRRTGAGSLLIAP